MDAPVPIIYARQGHSFALSWAWRLFALAAAAGALSVLGIAAWLAPDGHGIGSHRQLGLEPCQFEWRTGLPCPTCGMTTSFSYFAHGKLLASFYVQPMGMILALITAMVFWAALYIAVTGRPAQRVLRWLPGMYYGVFLFGGLILAWAWKIWIHLRGIDGWG